MEQSSVKRVALIFSGDFPEGNTKNARLKALAMGLVKSDIEVDFVSAYPSRFSKRGGFVQSKNWDGFNVYRMSFGRTYATPFVMRLLQLASAHITILYWTLLKTKSYQALYYYNPRVTNTLWSLLLAKRMGKTIVVDQTELYSLQNPSKAHAYEERKIAEKSNLLFVISKELESHFKSLNFKGKLLRLPIMVDFGRFNPMRKVIPNTIGYIGSFGKKDGIQTMLEGFKLAYQENSELKLRLIGYSPDEKGLKAQIKDLGIEAVTEVTGLVSFEEIPWLLKECDTLIMNRERSEYAAHGYPIKLGEYIACKRTILMSNGPGFSEDFEDGNQVIKYEVDNAQALADAISYRYKNKSEADAVASRAYKFGKDNFDKNKNSLFFANAIKQLKTWR